MSWIGGWGGRGVLPIEMDDDWPPQESRTKEEVRLHRLRDRLAQQHWNFSLTYHSFDGFSEGVCLLGGLDPTESEQAEGQYGPAFLPGRLAMYWTGSYPTWADAWQLRYSVHEGLSRYAALGLKGLVSVRDAIMAATKAGLDLPWLEAANGDFECARRLPPSLVTNEAVWKEIRSRHATSAGRSRAEKAAKTRFLQDFAKPIFDQMAARGFKKEDYAESSGRPVAARIAQRVYNKTMDDKKAKAFLEDNPAAQPDYRAFVDNVRRWLTALEKSSQQKKQ